jgi:hypothetical protein
VRSAFAGNFIRAAEAALRWMLMSGVQWALTATQQSYQFSNLRFRKTGATFWLRLLAEQFKPCEQDGPLPLIEIKHLHDCRLH